MHCDHVDHLDQVLSTLTSQLWLFSLTETVVETSVVDFHDLTTFPSDTSNAPTPDMALPPTPGEGGEGHKHHKSKKKKKKNKHKHKHKHKHDRHDRPRDMDSDSQLSAPDFEVM